MQTKNYYNAHIQLMYSIMNNGYSGISEKFFNFIKTEKEKGDRVSNCVKHILENLVTSDSISAKDFWFDTYTSGRTFRVFDEVSLFNESICEMGQIINKSIYFCEQEIESYARSYRMFRYYIYFDNREVEVENLVKIFEFKPSKI